MANESMKTRELCRALEALGAMTYPLVGSDWQPPGWPDRIVIHKKWFGFLECKVNAAPLSPLQKRRCSELSKRGASVYVLRYRRDAMDLERADGTHVARVTNARELLDACSEGASKLSAQ